MEFIQNYAFKIKTPLNFNDAIAEVTRLLKENGFGILTEIDVKATLKKKIDVSYKPYVILGACNPNFAHKALASEEHIGVLLPCNVVVWDDGDSRTIAAMDPGIMAQVIDNPEITEIAANVREKITSVLKEIEKS